MEMPQDFRIEKGKGYDSNRWYVKHTRQGYDTVIYHSNHYLLCYDFIHNHKFAKNGDVIC